MNNFKKFVIKNYRKHCTFALRCMSLLMNVINIEQAYEILFAILIALQVHHFNSETLHIVNNLIMKINTLLSVQVFCFML